MIKPRRGEVWLVNLDPTVGSEIQKTRPAVIFSRTDYNLVAETITLLPVSSGRYIPSLHTALSAFKKKSSHAVIPQIRVASKQRLIKKMGEAKPEELREMDLKLRFYLDMV